MRILISGAGIAGPTLAWLLAKSGKHQITILEKTAALLPHGQNVDLSGSAITAIKRMGLLEEVRKLNTREMGTKLINPKGKPIAPFPAREGLTASPTSEFEILRGDLAALLYGATKELEDVEYMFSTMIDKVVENTEEDVTVLLNNGDTRTFDLLVAADGQWSRVRKQCFKPEEVNSIHKGMYAVYYTVPRLPQDDDWWNIYVALRSRVITTRPDPHGTIRAMYGIMPTSDAQAKEWKEAARSDRKTQEALLKKEFTGAGWETERLLDAVAEAPDFYFHDISQIRMSKWHTNRIICLGDTAFAPTPLTGMGTSLAVIGAYVLAGELNSCETHDPTAAFRAYEEKFRPFVEQSQEIPPMFPGLAFPSTALGRWAWQSLLRVVSRLIAVPWVLRRIGGDVDTETRDEGFKLPDYPCFSKLS